MAIVVYFLRTRRGIRSLPVAISERYGSLAALSFCLVRPHGLMVSSGVLACALRKKPYPPMVWCLLVTCQCFVCSTWRLQHRAFAAHGCKRRSGAWRWCDAVGFIIKPSRN